MSAAEDVKLYFDFKSPFSYLAAEPAFELPEHFAIRVRWIPFQLRIKGKGERSQYSEWKAKYSYLDARRWANRRGGFPIKGPLKVYDSTPALIGGFFAERAGFFRPYALEVFARFFRRELELDVAEDVAALIDQLGHSGADYRAISRMRVRARSRLAWTRRMRITSSACRSFSSAASRSGATTACRCSKSA